jgi:uncharacterized protein (TIGR00290 family)
MSERIVVSWSGGKDSALMLDRLLRDERYEVVALVTTVDAASQRVSAHGVRRDLVARQAEAIGLPLLVVELPSQPSNDVYLAQFAETLAPLREDDVYAIAFGDLFLADLRAWRERSFSAIGMSSIFPLWHEASHAVADAISARGFAAVLCCVNGAYLGREYLGRLYDARLFASLPDGVDRCGENGEFHTFAFDGPLFREPVRYVVGEARYEPLMPGSPVAGHWFCDLQPAETRPTRCPLCGGDNECAATAGEPTCWCFGERIPPAVRERIPPYAIDVACICRACAQGGVAQRQAP